MKILCDGCSFENSCENCPPIAKRRGKMQLVDGKWVCVERELPQRVSSLFHDPSDGKVVPYTLAKPPKWIKTYKQED